MRRSGILAKYFKTFPKLAKIYPQNLGGNQPKPRAPPPPFPHILDPPLRAAPHTASPSIIFVAKVKYEWYLTEQKDQLLFKFVLHFAHNQVSDKLNDTWKKLSIYRDLSILSHGDGLL